MNKNLTAKEVYPLTKFNAEAGRRGDAERLDIFISASPRLAVSALIIGVIYYNP